MKNYQVYEVYKDMRTSPCPLTERLIQSGYQQQDGTGYLEYARKQGRTVDYRRAEPSQWWHLIHSYCLRSDPARAFSASITCGELVFWMAEVTEAVPEEELKEMLERIVASAVPVKRREGTAQPRVHFDRRRWNKEIHDLCYLRICNRVEELYSQKESTRLNAAV